MANLVKEETSHVLHQIEEQVGKVRKDVEYMDSNLLSYLYDALDNLDHLVMMLSTFRVGDQ